MPVFAVRAPVGAVRVPDVAAGTGIKAGEAPHFAEAAEVVRANGMQSCAIYDSEGMATAVAAAKQDKHWQSQPTTVHHSHVRA
eukprot:s3369_g11.t1